MNYNEYVENYIGYSGLKGIWITWEIQQRNSGLSRAFNYQLYEIDIIGTRFKRYFKSIIKTIMIIIKEKPHVVVAQNPSIVLSLLVLFCRAFFKYYLVIDAHSSGIFPFGRRYLFFNLIARFLLKNANLTLVTNQNIADYVKKNGGFPCVLPDKLPVVPSGLEKKRLDGTFNLVFICSYHNDEPYLEVIEAAKKIRESIKIFITGNPKNLIDLSKLPKNVQLTGYLPKNQYWSLLCSADIIMDLTTRENCLVCGAYEATTLEKPMILSNTEVTVQLFNKGSIYTESTIASITSSIEKAVNELDRLTREVTQLKSILEVEWRRRFDNCTQVIKTGLQNY